MVLDPALHIRLAVATRRRDLRDLSGSDHEERRAAAHDRHARQWVIDAQCAGCNVQQRRKTSPKIIGG
jgi:hypothetical protein